MKAISKRGLFIGYFHVPNAGYLLDSSKSWCLIGYFKMRAIQYDWLLTKLMVAFNWLLPKFGNLLETTNGSYLLATSKWWLFICNFQLVAINWLLPCDGYFALFPYQSLRFAILQVNCCSLQTKFNNIV